jgi:hypothetical protein
MSLLIDVSYRHHLWYTYIVFFLLMITLNNLLSAVWGRAITVSVQSTFDYSQFEEVPIFADLTEEDTSTYFPVEWFEGTVSKTCLLFQVVLTRMMISYLWVRGSPSTIPYDLSCLLRGHVLMHIV